jgi:hypothetical protein
VLKSEAMDAVEALGIIHAEQGFLVLSTFSHQEIGDVIGQRAFVTLTNDLGNVEVSQVSQPVRVLGLATFDEYRRQTARIAGMVFRRSEVNQPFSPLAHFYKVAAVD